MPHALTEREKEYLQFLRDFISTNESSPQLQDVAESFGVKLPSAHKVLDALQRKGYLVFRRGAESGYYIRLSEQGGGIEKAIEILIIGQIDEYGEIIDLPNQLGHFPVVLIGVDENKVFALKAARDIPQGQILTGDYLICDYSKRPQPGDLAILPFGKQSNRWFLCRIYSMTLDADLDSLEVSNLYPIPASLLDTAYGQRLNWAPIGYDQGNEKYLLAEAEKERVPLRPIPPEFSMATVLRLYRNLAS
jgi:SOS-response transcriptional repressor LexA